MKRKCETMPVTGQRFQLPREGKDPVDVIVNRPSRSSGTSPALFNLHGGAWVGGDAALLNSMCVTFAEGTPALVVNINYKKADKRPFPYQIEELCDTLRYFAAHADEFRIDPEKFAIMGESAGANLCAGGAILAVERGLTINRQILVYPFVDFTGSLEAKKGNAKETKEAEANRRMIEMMKGLSGTFDLAHPYASPLLASEAVLAKVAPADIVICGNDYLRPHGIAYFEKLTKAGNTVTLKEYPNAEHGFIEVNRDDYTKDPRQNPEQLAYTKDCEQYIMAILKSL